MFCLENTHSSQDAGLCSPLTRHPHVKFPVNSPRSHKRQGNKDRTGRRESSQSNQLGNADGELWEANGSYFPALVGASWSGLGQIAFKILSVSLVLYGNLVLVVLIHSVKVQLKSLLQNALNVLRGKNQKPKGRNFVFQVLLVS